MKKIVLSFLLLIAIGMVAEGKKDDSKYLADAVPEVNGTITFVKSFTVPGKSAQEVCKTMQQFVNGLVENSISAPGNYARIMDENSDSTVARVCEWLVFTKKAFNLDRARFRYQIKVNTTGQRVTITVSNLSYYYNEDMETQNGTIIKAEEWISDKEALNKTKTKLYPKSGKFRRKTIDRMEELFNAAMDAFETESQAPAKPVRKKVVED